MKKCIIGLFVLIALSGLAFTSGSVDSVSDLKVITEQGDNFFTEDEKGENNIDPFSLHYAVKRNDSRTVEDLISQGSDVNRVNNEGNTPLMVALREVRSWEDYQRRLSLIYKLLRANGDLNVTDHEGNTALMVAINVLSSRFHEYHLIELLKTFIEKGAGVNNSNNEGKTALYYAIEYDSIDLIGNLLTWGAVVDFSDKSGTILIQEIVENNNVEIAKVIAPAVINANKNNSESQTLLDLILQRNNFEMAKIFMPFGASVFDDSKIVITDTNVNSYLEFILTTENSALLQRVLDYGIDVNFKLENRKTSFIVACENGNLSIAKKLLEFGADIEVLDKDGNSALMYASQNGYIDIVAMLIDEGAYLEAENNSGKTAFDFAYSNRRLDIFQTFINSGFEIESYMWFDSIISGDIDFVKAMLDSKIDINMTTNREEKANYITFDISNNTALLLASLHGHLDIVTLLVEAGAELDTQSIVISSNSGHFDNEHNTAGSALSLAYRNNHTEVFDYLLDNNANVNTNVSLMRRASSGDWYSYTFGYSLLMFAIQQNDLKTVQTLIEMGADGNAEEVYFFREFSYYGTYEKTPLILACELGHEDIAELLIEKGADVNTTVENNNENYYYTAPTTALEAARNGGHTQIVNLLKRTGAEE